jgi:hypothetical protein
MSKREAEWISRHVRRRGFTSVYMLAEQYVTFKSPSLTISCQFVVDAVKSLY